MTANVSAHLDRRTKIIATVGPASWEPAVLEQLIAAGADVFRLNFSHAGPERQAQTNADCPCEGTQGWKWSDAITDVNPLASARWL